MPRSGGGIYSKPAGTTAVPNTTIESSKYNSTIDDLVTDANAARPISAGGTGSTTAADARTALGISATNTPFTPTGAIAATNVQTALAEVDTEKAALAGATFTGNIVVPNASLDTHALNTTAATSRFVPLAGGAETTIASASTTDLSTATSYEVAVTGTTTITSFGAGLNQNRQVRFVASLTITHNATTLICPDGKSIITAAGDVAICQSDGSGNWRVVQYFRAGVDGVSVTWTDIASAATMDVGAVASENLRVTGAVTVTSLGTAASGVTRTLRAAAGFQLTHSANLVCPNSVNLVLAADDFVRVASLGGGVWHVTDTRLSADRAAIDSALGYRLRAAVNFSGVPLSGTYSRTGTLITVTITAHGMTTGQAANLDFTTGTATDGTYTVTVTGVDTFTVNDTVSGATSGNVTRQIFIRSSLNVSSITDNGVGDYTVNFTTALPDANYAVTGTADPSVIGSGAVFMPYPAGTKTTTALRISVAQTGVGAIDREQISACIFR